MAKWADHSGFTMVGEAHPLLLYRIIAPDYWGFFLLKNTHIRHFHKNIMDNAA